MSNSSFLRRDNGNHFDKSYVEYLEYLAIGLAIVLGYPLVNTKKADEPYIKKKAKEKMDEAFEDIKRIFSNFGLTIFEK